jgi:hypothetical protein
MVRGLRTAEEARGRWTCALGRLRAAAAGVKRRRPAGRRLPDADRALDRLSRSLADCPLAEEQQGELEGLIADLRALAGVPAPGRRGSPMNRRAWNIR